MVQPDPLYQPKSPPRVPIRWQAGQRESWTLLPALPALSVTATNLETHELLQGETHSLCDTSGKITAHPCSSPSSTPLPEILNIPSGQQPSGPSWIQTKAVSSVSISPEPHWNCKAAAPDVSHFCSSSPVAKLHLLTC